MNNLRSCFLWFVLFFTASLLAQQKATMDSILKLPSTPEAKIKLAESLLQVEIGNDSIAYLYNQYAYWLYDHDIERTITYEQKALRAAKSVAVLDTFFIQKSSLSLGFYYQKVNKYPKAISAYRDVILLKNDNINAIKAYSKLGYCYDQIFNYPKAIENYKLVTQLLSEKIESPGLLRDTYFNIASISLKLNGMKALQEGIENIRIADSMASQIPTNNNKLFGIKKCFAELYNQHETLDIEKANYYYDQAYQVAYELNDTLKIRDIYFGKGSLYNTTDQEKSINYLEKSLALTQKDDSLRLYFSTNDLGLAYGYKGDFRKSIEYLLISIPFLTGETFNSKINERNFIESEHKQQLLYAIPLLAKTYLRHYEQKKDLWLLDESLSYFDLADRIIDQISISSNEFTSRLFWRKVSSELYGMAIRACYLKGDAEKAFYYMEKNKALLFLEDASQQQFVNSLELPIEFFDREKELLTTVLELESKIKSNEALEDGQTQTKKQLVDTKLQLEALRGRYEIPLNRLATPSIADLKTVQKNLGASEMILEYNISIDDGFGIYSNNDKGYVLAVTKDKIYFYEIAQLSELKENLKVVIEMMKAPFKTQEEISSYTKLSFDLYHSLFPSDELRQLVIGKRLTIVPDHFLSFLPFEALSVLEEETKYLILQSEIHYVYSNSFLSHLSPKKREKVSALGMAPVNFKEKDLIKLRHSEEEIVGLNKYFDGVSLLRDEATTTNFLKHLDQHTILHLATHADAQDEQSPWIAFANQKITLEDLYLTNNNASLVVLSGCNTNLGKQETGEGVMSLARGFFYGGAQSVVSSLWSIDDRSTAKIVNSFYTNLSEGDKKSLALHKAKSNYLATHELSEASPYYWASFVLLGSNDSIEGNSFIYSFLYIGVFAFLLLLGFFYFRKKKKMR